MENLKQETKFILQKYGITANKSLGQNFLISEEVLEAMVESANITKQDFVIEIGPGLGTLTKYLLEKAGKVLCIELDTRMLEILKDRFSLYQNFSLLHQDVLKVDLKQIIKEEKQKNNLLQKVKIVANLPYYITSPIIMKLLEEKLDIESITVMVQKEVAQRLIAIPGEKETGAITYTVYYYAEGRKVVEVPNNSFIPEPEVDSEVICLKIRKEKIVDIKNEVLFFRIIKTAFLQRRKTLLNALLNGQIIRNKEKGKEIFKNVGIEETIRGEKLTIQQYAKLTKEIEKN